MSLSRTATRLGVLFGAALAVSQLTAPGARADAVGTLDATVAAAGTTGADVIDLHDLTYGEAVAELTDALDGTATLPVAPAGTGGMTSTGAEVHHDDDRTAIAVTGATSVVGLPATLLVTAQWDDPDTDTSADTAVLVSFDDPDLGALVPGLDLPIAVRGPWIGLATTDHTVDPDRLPAGVADDLGGPFTVRADGVAFGADLDVGGTPLADLVSGVGLSETARLAGVLTTDLGSLGGSSTELSTTGLSLTATLVASGDGSALPDWFTPTGDWTLSVAAEDGGDVSVDVAGGADITIGEDTVGLHASAGLSHDDETGVITASLSATASDVEDLFGEAWLDLQEVVVDATVASDGSFGGGLSATVDLEGLTGTASTAAATIAFEAGGGSASGTVDLSTDASVAVSQLLTAVGAEPPSGLDVTVSGFALHVAFASGDSGTELTVAATAESEVTVNDATIASSALVRVTTGGSGGRQFVIGIRPQDDADRVTVGQLLGADLGGADVELPAFTLTASSTDWDVAAEDLDLPTASYLGDGHDLSVGAGVRIVADVDLPDAVEGALAELGIAVESGLVLEGELPVFGSTSLSLAVQLPALVGDQPPFRSGSLALVVARRGAGIELGLEGAVTIAVPRPEASGCADSTDGQCLDELTFTVDATLRAGPTGVELELAGDLSGGDDGWQDPFGLRGLAVHQVRLEVGVVVGTSGSPRLDVGLLADLEFGDTRVRVSFLLGITPTPPFLDPLGFSFATSGFGLLDLTALYEAVSGEDVPDALSIPTDLRLEDVFVSYGRTSDADLCLATGFFLTAELHLGGVPAGSVPDCDGEVPAEPDVVADHCEASPSCLAAVLVDVRTGTGSGAPSVNAAGLLAALDLGPIHFDPVRIELTLSASQQRLFVSGGAALDDPVTGTEWVSGRFALDFTSTQLSLSAEVSLLEGEALHIGVRGSAALSLTEPSFTLELTFRSGLLESIADEVAGAFEDLATVVDDFVAQLADAGTDERSIFRNLEILLSEDGTAPAWLVSVVDKIASVEETVRGINSVFIDAGLGAPILVTEIIDIVLDGFTIGFDGLDGPVVAGVCVGWWVDESCYLIPPARWEISGLCDTISIPQPFRSLLCEDLRPDDVAGELFEDELEERGLELPAGTTGTEALEALDQRFDGDGVRATCGVATASYASHSISDAEVTMQINGAPVVFDAPLDLVGDPRDLADSRTVQAGLDALLADAVDGDRCRLDAEPTPSPSAAMELEVEPSTVYEGESLTVEGAVELDEGDAITDVTIRWGDGEQSTVEVTGDGTFSADHTYRDDPGSGGSNTLTIEATGTTDQGLAIADREPVTVRNVAPTATASVDEPEVDEGGVVRLGVELTDPGDDRHTIEVTWSDGARDVVSLSGGARDHTFVRTVVDDDPTGTSSDELAADVVVRDDDRGVGTAGATVTVRNVAPAVMALEAIHDIEPGDSLDDCRREGDLVVDEAEGVFWKVTFTDPGVGDTHAVDVDWADGSTSTVAVARGTDPERCAYLAHTYVDDDPSFTSMDDYAVGITVTDDDTGRVEATSTVTVRNVAPAITVAAASDVAPAENEEIELTVEFDDPGTQDIHQFGIDWDDGAAVEVVTPPIGDRSITVPHTWGDDGLYTVTVSMIDDDLDTDETTVVVGVGNVAPSMVLDRSTTFAAPGGDTYMVRSGVDLDVRADATDPGSDDLTFSWSWGDDEADTVVDLVNPPDPDPARSPTVQPRTVESEVSHRYGPPCLRTMVVDLDDDDGGHTGDEAPVVVVGPWKHPRPTTFWQLSYATSDGFLADLLGYVPDATEVCHLATTRHLSLVFGEARGLQTKYQAKTILQPPPLLDLRPAVVKARYRFDRHALSVWLNVAAGATGTDDAGFLVAEFAERIYAAEAIRLDPNATARQINAAAAEVIEAGFDYSCRTDYLLSGLINQFRDCS